MTNFKEKAITRTVDAFPGKTPLERFRLLLEERQTYPKHVLDVLMGNLESPKVQLHK